MTALVNKAIEKQISEEKPHLQDQEKNEHIVKTPNSSVLDKPDVATTVKELEEKDVFPVVDHHSSRFKSIDAEEAEHTTVERFPSKLAPKKQFGSMDADLIKTSLCEIAVCSVKCPAYFKSLYRLAATFCEMGLVKESRDILLGPLPSALVEQQEKLLPLFVLRGNIFSVSCSLLEKHVQYVCL